MATIPYAHITRRPVFARPVLARPALVPVVVPPRRGINPLIPLCCLGLTLCLIASTIVLALIPVYLQVRGSRADLQTVPYNVLYRMNNGTLPLGDLRAENCNAIRQDQQTLAASNTGVSPSVPIVTRCAVTGNTTVTRRRRRQTGQPEGNLISVDGNLPGTRFCRRGRCLTRRAEIFIALLLGRGPFFLTFTGANGTQYVFLITVISASISPPVSVSGVGNGGSQTGNGVSPTGNAALNNDIAILNYALVLEQLEQFFYNTYQNNFTSADFVAAGFTNETYTYFSLIQSHENTHVNVLTSVIIQLGGTPVVPCTYNFSAVVDVKSYFAIAAVLENTGGMAYSGAANGIADPMLREMAATVETIETRHAAYINILNGAVPFPDIFENAKEPSVIIQLVQPFIISCPFPLIAPTVPYIGSSSFNGTIPITNETSISPYTDAMYKNDLRALNFALVGEQLESTFYNTFVENITQAEFTAAGFPDMTTRLYFVLIREYEAAHVTFLRTTITQRGGTPVSPCNYNFNNVTNALSFVQLSRLFENTGVSAYDGAIDTISDPNIIRGAAVIAAVEARFASFLNLLLGDVPFPNAFDPTRTPAEVVEVLSPFQTCPFTPDLPVVLVPSPLVLNL